MKVQKSPDKLNAKVYSIENSFLADPDPSGSEFAFGIRVNNPVPEQTNLLYRISKNVYKRVVKNLFFIDKLLV